MPYSSPAAETPPQLPVLEARWQSAQPPPSEQLALPLESTEFPIQGLQWSPAMAELPWALAEGNKKL